MGSCRPVRLAEVLHDAGAVGVAEQQDEVVHIADEGLFVEGRPGDGLEELAEEGVGLRDVSGRRAVAHEGLVDGDGCTRPAKKP